MKNPLFSGFFILCVNYFDIVILLGFKNKGDLVWAKFFLSIWAAAV